MLYALQQRDDPYLEIVEKYDNDRPEGERAPDHYSRAFGQLQQGMAATDADLLGVIYEAYGTSNDAFGQYFTPHNICDFMAEMNMETVEPDRYSREDPLTVADPACGSGRLLVSAAQTVPDGVQSAVFYGQDKDATCAKMTALNLCLFNLDGYAVMGDSLRVEARRLWRTRSTPLGGEVRELDVDEVGNPFAAGSDGSEYSEAGTGQSLETVADVDVRQAGLERWSS